MHLALVDQVARELNTDSVKPTLRKGHS
jgi:hypothetical protein